MLLDSPLLPGVMWLLKPHFPTVMTSSAVAGSRLVGVAVGSLRGVRV